LIGKTDNIDGYDGKVIVCISHAMFLKQTKHIHTDMHKVVSPVNVIYKLAGISLVKWDETGEKYYFIEDGYSEHIEVKGLDRYRTYNVK